MKSPKARVRSLRRRSPARSRRSSSTRALDEDVLERRRHGSRDAARLDAAPSRSAAASARGDALRLGGSTATCRRSPKQRRAAPGARADLRATSAAPRAPAAVRRRAPPAPPRRGERCSASGVSSASEPSLVEQRHAVAALGLVEVGGRDDHGDPFGHHLVDDAARARGATPDRRRRWARRAAACSGWWTSAQESAELLLHAAGELAGQAVLERAEVGEAIQPLEPRRPLGAAAPVEVGVEVEVLAHGEVGVEAEALRHVGEVALHPPRARRARWTPSSRARRRRVGPQHAGEHAQRRGLAGAVRADEAEQLAAAHLELSPVDRGQRRRSGG